MICRLRTNIPPPLIFSQKQRFPFNNLQRNLKLSCLSQALCLALVGFSTVAVAQQTPTYDRTFDELIGTGSGALIPKDKITFTKDPISNFQIAEFYIQDSVEIKNTGDFKTPNSSNEQYILNFNQNFSMPGISIVRDGDYATKVTLKGRGASQWNFIQRNTNGAVLDIESHLNEEKSGLDIDAPNTDIFMQGGKRTIYPQNGAYVNITAKSLSIINLNNDEWSSGIYCFGNAKANIEVIGRNENGYDLVIDKGENGNGLGIFIQQYGGAATVSAPKMKISAPTALYASGYAVYENVPQQSSPNAKISLKSQRADIYGDVFVAGKAFINLDDEHSTYHVIGNLEAGRHESFNKNKVYEYADAGTINLAGVNTTLDGNAKAMYGGIVNIKLNNGRWTGMAINDTKPIQADVRFDENWHGDWGNPPLNYDTEGTINLTLNGANAIWNVTDNSQVTSITMRDHGVLNLAYAPTIKATAPAYHKVTTKTFSGSNGIVGFRTNLDGGTDQLIITDKATGTHRATIAMSGNADLDHSADWLIQQGGQASSMSFTNPKGKNEFSGRGMVTVWGLGFVPEGDENLLETEEGLKQIAANTTGTGVGNWYLIKQEYFEPDPGQPKPDQPLPDEIVENLSIGTSATQALAYQADLDDLRTRLGEVRYGAQDGAWVKAFTKKEKIGDGSALEQDVNGINVGLDTLVAAQEGSAWLVGGAFRYSNADQEGVALKHVSGELDEYSLKAYATWMHEQGSYADFVLQAGRYKQSLNGLDNTATGSSNAKYRTWGYGASVEVGHMFSFANDADDSPWTDHWFVEPQLQLAYFYAKGADYHTSTGLKVDQGNADFLMGRAGVAIGKKFNFSDANSLDRRYFQVSAIGGVKHDFIGGDQTIRYTGVDKKTVSVKADELDDTRFYYGVNFDWQLANNWRVYGQVSREEGDQYTKDYDFSLGLKYAF